MKAGAALASGNQLAAVKASDGCNLVVQQR